MDMNVTTGGGWGVMLLPILPKLQESWSKVSHAAREVITVFSETFSLVTVVGQMTQTPPPPDGKCLSTSLVMDESHRVDTQYVNQDSLTIP